MTSAAYKTAHLCHEYFTLVCVSRDRMCIFLISHVREGDKMQAGCVVTSRNKQTLNEEVSSGGAIVTHFFIISSK